MAPRYFTLSVYCKCVLLSIICGVFLSLLLVKMIASVFSVFVWILHLENQFVILCMCVCNVRVASFYVCMCTIYMAMSSAYCAVFVYCEVGMSCVYMLYKVGASTEPWGTPPLILCRNTILTISFTPHNRPIIAQNNFDGG